MYDMTITILTLFLVAASSVASSAANENWKKTWLMETDELPRENSTGEWLVDYRKMAAVGNGHVATVLYSPIVYMNGLYNGPVGWTHRAAIQSTHDVTINVQGRELSRHFSLDMWTAVFTETLITEGLEIKVMTYAHQRVVQLLVTEVHVTRTNGGRQEFVLHLERSDMNSTVDLIVEDPVELTDLDLCTGTCKYTQGKTLITETDQAPVGEVHIYWTDIPPSLTLPPDDRSQKLVFFSAYDREKAKAMEAFQTALNVATLTPDLLLESHMTSWKDKWNAGRVDVDGDDDLATVIHSSYYYILMSLPSLQPHQPLGQFYGLSPGSLARGANWTDYQGHVFWDMETWMYPPILVLFPQLARDMLSYRIYGGEGARAKAREHGYKGWQFPWESAFTGYEMTPLVCVPCRENEQHITGDVAFAAGQYWAMTRDSKWLLQEGGKILILNTAEFWADRAEYNKDLDRYELNGVMPPDEYSQQVNNSIYTNYIAKLNLQLADYVACVSGQMSDRSVSDYRRELSDKLYLVFNHTGQFHPEYEGYDDVDTAFDHNQLVKQADTIMLGYPLGMAMDDDVRRNDLLLYTDRANPKGPAMTWSMFAINWLDLGDINQAATNFLNSYNLYRLPPFNTWWESASGITDTHRVGTSNFITGMGGFLQAVVFGYAGLRIELERLSFNPRLPPNTHSLRVTGINYLGATVDLLITNDTVLVVTRETSQEYPLQLRVMKSGTSWRLVEGRELILNREPFEIFSVEVTECPLPEGSSCLDVFSVDDSYTGRVASLPPNIQVVAITQTGAQQCRDFVQCARVIALLQERDDGVNFYIGGDSRLYQGSFLTKSPSTLRVALVGDYTLSGMTKEQEVTLRKLIKCGMESKPVKLDRNYTLRVEMEGSELCEGNLCLGLALRCQLLRWKHWDATQSSVDCTGITSNVHNYIQLSTQSSTHTARDVTCSPARAVNVTCHCPLSRGATVENLATRVTYPSGPIILGIVVVMGVFW